MTKKTLPIAQASGPPIFEPEVDVSVSSVSFTSHTSNSEDIISKDDKSLPEIEVNVPDETLDEIAIIT